MKRLFFILLVLSTGQRLWAQTSTTAALAFPTANNTFLGKVNTSPSVDVDLYTGMAVADIPICALPAGSLNIPITLSYVDGRGVKVQEYASQVGLGWQLSAGGSISRVVRGFPDESANGYLGVGPGNGALRWGQVVNNALSANTQFATGQYTELTGCTISDGFATCNSLPTADGEPDLFYVKTPFFSFQFVFDQNGNPVVSNYNGYKVISTNFFNTASGSSTFEVIDDRGNQYYFGTGLNTQEASTDTLYNVSNNFTSTWYLSQIVTYNNSDNITFTYAADPNSDTTYSYSWSEIENTLIQTQTTFMTGQSIVYEPKYLTTITSSEGSVQLNYAYNRQDDPHVPSLSSIVTSAAGPFGTSNTLQTYNFNYSYFGLPSTDPNVLRLELTGVTMTGNTSQTATPVTVASFGYNTTQNLANRTTLVFDYWGYNTPVPSPAPTDLFSISRSPNPTTTQAAILNSVTTLLGGTYNFYYEGNSFGPGSTAIGGVRVNKITQTLPTGELLYDTIRYDDGEGNSYGEIISPYYNQLQFYFGTSSQGATLYLSGSPYIMADVGGNFVGYSTVTKIAQNKGYSIYNFSNFNDPGCGDILASQGSGPGLAAPIIFSSTSVAYKRGLLKSAYVYNSGDTLLSQTANTYTSLNSTIAQEAWGFRPFNIGATLNNLGGGLQGFAGVYYTPYENYRLTQTVQTNYDQLHPANYVQTTTNFRYDANNWLIIQDSTTDAKGLPYTRRFYHTADAGIPLTSSTDLTALADMLASNRTDVLVHEVDTRNGVVSQLHNSFTAEQVTNLTNVFQTGVTTYAGSTLEKQQTLVPDPVSGNLISSSVTGGKSTAIQYGYNNKYPVVKIINASSSIATSTNYFSTTGTLSLSSNQGQAIFTTAETGSVVLTVTAEPGQTYTVNYLLSGGPSNTYTASNSLCATRDNGTCSFPSTVTLTNVPAGTYTLIITEAGGQAAEVGSVAYTYTTSSITETPTSEFFYEGFEANSSATIGTSHTGNMYWNAGAYSVPFTLPNSRAYTIQWWNWSNGKWVMNQQNYTGSLTINGIIDDVRVFPTDALMTTYTYAPLVGKTGEIDPSGRATTYQYDGFGRLNLVRDDDGNILKKYCYSYAGQPLACIAGTIYTNAAESGTFTPTTCPAGSAASPVTYTVAAGTYSSTISQTDANQQAIFDVNQNGQAYANTHAVCVTTYFNVAESGSYTRNNCGAGYAGSTVTYTVAAGTYSSTVSQAAANQLAINDVNANGQNYANTNGTCTSTSVLTTRDLSLTGNTASVTFTTSVVQSITLTEDNNPGVSYSLVYTITGAKGETGYTCISHTTTKCSYPTTISFASMPAGTYTLTIQLMSGTSSLKGMTYSYYAIP